MRAHLKGAALVAVMLVAGVRIATASSTDNYAAPFGDTGTSSLSAPTLAPPTIAADVINEVPPSVPPGAPPVFAPPPPVSPTAPPPPVLDDEVNKAGQTICKKMIPYARAGFKDYVDTYGAGGSLVMYFFYLIPGNMAGIDQELVKNCIGYGYYPTEIDGSYNCSICESLNTSVPDGFYAAHTTGTDADGNPIYDFSTVTPTYLKSCLEMGQRPPETVWNWGEPSGSCVDSSLFP